MDSFFERSDFKIRLAALMAAFALALAGFLLGLSIAASLFRWTFINAAPGRFLFQAYGMLAFLVPLWLFWAAWILGSPRFRPGRIFALAMSIVPFMTLAVGFSFIRDFAIRETELAWVRSLGRTGLGFVALTAGFVETAAIVVLHTLCFSQNEVNPDTPKQTSSLAKILAGILAEAKAVPVPVPEGTTGDKADGKTVPQGKAPGRDVVPDKKSFSLPDWKPPASPLVLRDLEQFGDFTPADELPPEDEEDAIEEIIEPEDEADDTESEIPEVELEDEPGEAEDAEPEDMIDKLENMELEDVEEREDSEVREAGEAGEVREVRIEETVDPETEPEGIEEEIDNAIEKDTIKLEDAIELENTIEFEREPADDDSDDSADGPEFENQPVKLLPAGYCEDEEFGETVITGEIAETGEITETEEIAEAEVEVEIAGAETGEIAEAEEAEAQEIIELVEEPVLTLPSSIFTPYSQVHQVHIVQDETYSGQKIPAAEADHLPHHKTKKSKTAYSVPVDGILSQYADGQYWIIDEDTNRAAKTLQETLKEFGIQAEVTGIRKGPVITMFEILPAPGVKLSKIVNLQDNIALRLAASSVRIVAPIPGKHAVGIEVPNKKRNIVSFREIIENELHRDGKKLEVPVVLGKDITGEALTADLTQMPHLLIAGSTGSGKSVCVNSMILSILYQKHPAECKLILIDPKIVELKLYNDIPHLLTPVITEPKKAFQALQYCIFEMERRYACLDSMGVRDIKSYNRRIKERGIAAEYMPYIVVVIDEFADLMATTGKELESTVARLAAMSRAVGIHLVLATQRPSIDVITGLIKANIPSRIAFMVASKMDSRIIIDMVGAEKLLGKGDMLYAGAVDPFPIRLQGTFVSEEEVERVVDYVKTLGEPEYIDDEIFYEEEEEPSSSMFTEGDDPLYDKAVEVVMQQGKASASYIQRRLKIGYNRAARLVEEMEHQGLVGPAQGSKPREILRGI
ncbi:MAG: DNA translocase FtsK [Treponema sp.]|jgi:S-DNA-T family DNA segregation ATPase FtsK/SpoIIIE|nr:DNA translocase FtsK [Treponema sp.]